MLKSFFSLRNKVEMSSKPQLKPVAESKKDSNLQLTDHPDEILKQLEDLSIESTTSISVEDINHKYPGDNTLLHHLADRGLSKYLLWALNEGADINAKNEFGHLPIERAIRGDHWEAMKVLIHSGFALDWIDAKGNTLLHLAAKNGSILCLKWLIKKGLKVDHPNYQLENSFHTAVAGGRYNTLKRLIKYGHYPLNDIIENQEKYIELLIRGNNPDQLSIMDTFSFEWPSDYSVALDSFSKALCFNSTNYIGFLFHHTIALAKDPHDGIDDCLSACFKQDGADWLPSLVNSLEPALRDYARAVLDSDTAALSG